MYADDRRLAVLMGARNISSGANLILAVYPRNGDVADRVIGAFEQPQVTAYFRDFR